MAAFRSAALFLLFVCLVSVCPASAKKSYHRYSVLRTGMLDADQAKLLDSVMVSSTDFDFWTSPAAGRSVDIMASPKDLSKLINLLQKNNVSFATHIKDVQRVIRKNEMLRERSVKPSPLSSPDYKLDWNNYYSHEDINAFLDALAKKYPWVATESIGKTHQGRDIMVLKITKAGPGKPNVIIDAGIHAREWIANAVCTYIIRELVENYDQHKDIVDSLNFHFVPLLNPDGYEHSRAEDRYWRKNMFDNDGDECIGVDLNRNFGFHWGAGGASSNPCSDIYNGKKAFSELETNSLRKYAESLSPVPVLGQSIHSYSQVWLWPYGFDYVSRPDNWEENKALAELAVEAMLPIHQTVYVPMNAGDFGVATGASDDWYKGGLKTRFAFTLELRDIGDHGFDLPPDQIIPNSEEVWEAMKVVFRTCIKLEQE